MNIYYFSAHAPEPEMVKDLGAPVTSRFKGDVNDIHRDHNKISFTETLFIGGQRIKSSYTIPADSIVIVEAPPLLQGDWLAAGVTTLLVPIRKKETSDKGRAIYKYYGLEQVKSIEVITYPWSNAKDKNQGNNTYVNENQQVETNDKKVQPISTTEISTAFKFSFFGRKSKQAAV
jgi:hypothetical protein